MTDRKLVLVEWIDACSEEGNWECLSCLEDEDLGYTTCQTVGWLLKEDEKTVAIVSSITEHDSGCFIMRIPSVNVVSMKELRRK